jgi:hypothetical protein
MVSLAVGSFKKQAACPSSKTLLDFRSIRLRSEVRLLIEWHLDECDFCWAEMKLLAYYVAPGREESRPPSIPVNLRMLAEALLLKFRSSQPESKKQVKC